jgi:hypothetical protein
MPIFPVGLKIYRGVVLEIPTVSYYVFLNIEIIAVVHVGSHLVAVLHGRKLTASANKTARSADARCWRSRVTLLFRSEQKKLSSETMDFRRVISRGSQSTLSRGPSGGRRRYRFLRRAHSPLVRGPIQQSRSGCRVQHCRGLVARRIG